MFHFSRGLVASAMSVLLIMGCDNSAAQEPDHVSILQASIQENGASWNGASWNGASWNGSDLEGVTIAGSMMSAVVRETREKITGVALIGKTMTVRIDMDGQMVPVQMRVDTMENDATAPTNDVYLYSMSFRNAGDREWRSVCRDAAGNAAPLIPISGYHWDMQTGQRTADSQFVTLACASGALGSCIRWGYRPWAMGEVRTTLADGSQHITPVSLLDYHQACIHLKRADYCGNGTTHTVNGTLIDVYDNLTPQIQARSQMSWAVEAHWGPQGATCIGTRRHPEIPFSGSCQRDGQLVTLPSCSNTEEDGALLYNAVAPTL